MRLVAADRDQFIVRTLEIFNSFDVEGWKGFNVVAAKDAVRVRRPE